MMDLDNAPEPVRQIAVGWLPPARLVDTSGKSGSLCAAGALSYTGASTDPVDVNLTVAVIMTRP